MKIITINPTTEEKVAEYEVMSEQEVKSIVKMARQRFNEWKNTDISERVKLVRRLGDVLRKHKKEWAELITTEMGKPIRESLSEIEKCAWLCDYYADKGERFLGPEIIQTDAVKSYVRFDPIGVIASIMPWNFPFWQVLRFGVPAILAGNVSVLKHSSVCIGCSLAIVDAFKEAGFPVGVFQAVIGPASVGQMLLESEIDGISVTGSVATGQKVAEVGARRLKKFVLELGGSDPMIVLEDVDLELVCKGALEGRLINGGQSCIATKRVIVAEKIADEFIKRYVELTEAVQIGDPMDEKTKVGPLVRKSQLEEIESQVNDSVQMGAKILTGGRRLERKGYFYLPTVLIEVTRNMRVLREETFGPVTPIIVVKDENEAVKVANDSEFGLGASIWTKNLELAERIAKELEAGVITINKPVHSDPRLPFGGVKKSGIGRELSHYGLKEFVNIKSVKVYRP